MKSLKGKILLPIILLGVIAITLVFNSVIQGEKINTISARLEKEHSKYEALLDAKQHTEKTQKLLLAAYVMPYPEAKAGCIAATDVVAEELNVALEELKVSCEETDSIEMYDTIMARLAEIDVYTVASKDAINAGDQEKAFEVLGGMDMQETCGTFDDTLDAYLIEIKETIDKLTAQQQSLNVQVKTINTILGVIAVVLIIVSALLSFKSVIKPTVAAERQLKDIVEAIDRNEGDLSARVHYAAKDEIGTLVDGINSFIETLEMLISNIRGNTVGLLNTSATMSANIRTTDGNAINISSAMEELAATMEEVSATVSTVNEDTKEIFNHTNNMEGETEKMSSYSDEMADRANQLRRTAETNKAAAENMVNEILTTLKEAIENSKNVEQINSLTDEILSISSQTNLLALNASIEAARAGEAGKGFAVVADEIRVLADNSRNTANNIQEINSQVVQAVTALSNDSKRLIDFIDSNVLPDYDLLVNSGIQYSEDSDYINKGMASFADLTKEMQDMISRMTESISAINESVEEGTKGVTVAAEDTAQLVSEINSISEETETNKAISEQLSAETNRFIDFDDVQENEPEVTEE